jgi:hypothetical protein
MKCLACGKKPVSCVSLTFENKIGIVCAKCWEKEKISVCDNSYCFHEFDVLTEHKINGTRYCDKCYKHMKVSQLKNSETYKNLVVPCSFIEKYI